MVFYILQQFTCHELCSEKNRSIHLHENRREDVISANKDFAVVRNAPGHIAARLRVSEKNFVADHAQSLGQGR